MPASPIAPCSPSLHSNSTSPVSNGVSSGISHFECLLDRSGFADCVSPVTYTGLNAGQHTFQVRAWDSAGNVDPTAGGFSWRVIGWPS